MSKSDKMTEYERRRLENIKRNDEMLAALNIQSRVNDLSSAVSAAKRKSVESKSYKRSPVKKSKTESPVVLRRSLRTRGVSPDSRGLSDDIDYEKQMKKVPQSNPLSEHKTFVRETGPLSMRDAYTGTDGLNRKLVETISKLRPVLMRDAYTGGDELNRKLGETTTRCSPRISKLSEDDKISCESKNNAVKTDGFEGFKARKGSRGSVDVEALVLKPENVARLVPGRIMSVEFFPTTNMQMLVVGNKYGNLGFWNIKEEDGDGIYMYHPHSGPISGIVIDPFSVSKMYSSCYDGFIRLMDVEKEVFNMVYSSEYTIYSLSQSPQDTRSLYFGEGEGGVSMFDVRAGKPSLSWDLHEKRINTIDFNSENDKIMATSSTDGTACIWDLRRMSVDKRISLKIVSHKRAVHSAYFSPTGNFLATTSLDDKVGLSSGANFENTSMVYHFNQTGRWISTFRGTWGWDDSSVFIGNMKRGVDVISVSGKKPVVTLQSDLMTAITCRFAAHPYNVGTLAGATSGGQVYIWTKP